MRSYLAEILRDVVTIEIAKPERPRLWMDRVARILSPFERQRHDEHTLRFSLMRETQIARDDGTLDDDGVPVHEIPPAVEAALRDARAAFCVVQGRTIISQCVDLWPLSVGVSIYVFGAPGPHEVSLQLGGFKRLGEGEWRWLSESRSV